MSLTANEIKQKIVPVIEKRYLPVKHYSIDGLYEKMLSICVDYFVAHSDQHNALNKFCGSDNRYYQQCSEILTYYLLMQAGLSPVHPKSGPDFYVLDNNKRVWIEVITPENTEILKEYSVQESGKVYTPPHDEILLRWTSAISAKSKKIEDYLHKKVINSDDITVIAVSPRLLPFLDNYYGLSQLPYVLEATMAIGPQQVTMSKNGEILDQCYSHKEHAHTGNKNTVDLNIFCNNSYNHISAIWALNCDERIILSNENNITLVHNPFAVNKMSQGLLPSSNEYIVDEAKDKILKVAGQMCQQAHQP